MLAEFPVFPILLALDLDASRAFYHEVLGLEIAREDEDDRIVFRCGGGTQLVVTKSTIGTLDSQTQMAWRVPDIGAAIADLRARGVRIEEYEAPDPVTSDGVADMGHWLGLPGSSTRAATSSPSSNRRADETGFVPGASRDDRTDGGAAMSLTFRSAALPVLLLVVAACAAPIEVPTPTSAVALPVPSVAPEPTPVMAPNVTPASTFVAAGAAPQVECGGGPDARRPTSTTSRCAGRHRHPRGDAGPHRRACDRRHRRRSRP